MKSALIIGASGDVGFGITGALLDAGHRVIASSRSPDHAAHLKFKIGACGKLETLTGSVATDADEAQETDESKQPSCAAHGQIPHDIPPLVT